MIILLIISVLVVVLYVGATIWRKKDLPASISSLVYDLPSGWQWVWTIWIWLATYTLTPALFEVMPDSLCVVAHAFATSVLFIGAMPLVKHEGNKAHNVFGVAAGVFSQMCVLLINHCWLMMWFGFVASVFIVVYRKKKSLNIVLTDYGVFLSESFCWLTLVCCLFSEMV